MSFEIARQFGINLGRARRCAGLSQEALAVFASVHRTEVGLLERGERCPRIDTAVKLAAAPRGLGRRSGRGHRLEPPAPSSRADSGSTHPLIRAPPDGRRHQEAALQGLQRP